MADLLLRLIAEDAASSAFDSVSGAARKTAAILYDFGKDSLKAFAESERAHRQLERAAGDLTDAFEAQADAISKQLAVEDEQVKSMQTLLLSYGVMPRQVDGAVRAILDYAAVTGRDATDATMQLVKGIESGTGSLGRMGVSFTATGDQAKDLEAAIAALNGKFGGGAAADADTLEGRTRAASIAMGELKEAFGGLLATMESKWHILAKVTNVLNNMADARAWKYGTHGAEWPADESTATMPQDSAWHTPHLNTTYGKGVEVTLGELTLEPTKKKSGGSSGFHASALQSEAAFQQRMRVMRVQAYEQDLKDQEEHDQKKIQALRNLQELEAQIFADTLKRADDSSNQLQKKLHDELSQRDLDLRKQNEITVNRLESQEAMWANAGMQLGSAFAEALASAMEGGERDAEEIMIDLVASVLTIAGAVIGGVLGEGNPAAVQAGTMIGGLAGTGIKAAYKSNRRKKHDGGWIDRYHSGGWPGLGMDEELIIAQQGERVWSRAEVARAGGPAAVDAMARGGSGGRLVVNVSAIDTRSTREFFENDGGLGFRAALRTGRGHIPALFGGAA